MNADLRFMNQDCKEDLYNLLDLVCESSSIGVTRLYKDCDLYAYFNNLDWKELMGLYVGSKLIAVVEFSYDSPYSSEDEDIIILNGYDNSSRLGMLLIDPALYNRDTISCIIDKAISHSRDLGAEYVEDVYGNYRLLGRTKSDTHGLSNVSLYPMDAYPRCMMLEIYPSCFYDRDV